MFVSLAAVFTARPALADWWDTSWTLRIPITLDKPAGFEGAKYAGKIVEYTLDFSAIGVDGVDSNSIRVTRWTGTTWTDLPSKTSNWTDQDADTGWDRVDISFVIHANDLEDASETTVTYHIYFDITANGSKSAPGYGSLTTIKILCFDFDLDSLTCEELQTIAGIADFDINVSVSSTLSDLEYANLIQFDQLYFGWNAISKAGVYQLSGYETDIKNYAYDGGRVLCAASENNGWQSGWLPEPGAMTVVADRNANTTAFPPFDTTIFAYPNADPLSTVTEDERYENVPASYDIMAENAGKPVRKLYLRKMWGAGNYVLGSVDGKGANAALAHNYFENSIYWAFKWTNQPLQTSLNSLERYTVTDVTFYQSDYSTPLTTAQVGAAMYIELNENDLDDDLLATIPVTVTSTSDPAGIAVTLSETAIDTGKFRGPATLAVASNDPADEIEADVADIVTAGSVTELVASDTLTVVQSDPTAPFTIDFKTDDTYTTSLTGSVSIGSILYMEVTATDANSLSTDRVTVTLTSDTDPTGISVDLVETGRNTGIFRGTATVDETSNDPQDYIGASDGDTITVEVDLSPGTTDTCTVASSPPTSVTSITIYESDYSTNKTQAAGGETIYIELVGEDGNSYGIDNTVASVYSSVTDPTGISVQLTETGNNTGVYRGTATLGAGSSQPDSIIGAKKIGETVTAKSTVDPTKTDTVTVKNTPPTSIVSVILKTDATYTVDLTTDLAVGSTLYIELTAGDLNNQTMDQTTVKITSSVTDPAGINVTLTESGPNTGKFRGTAQIKPTSSDPLDQIGAGVGETITIKSNVDPAKLDTVGVISSPPTSITSTTLMSDANYNTPLVGNVSVGSTVYIEIVATDLNPESQDTTTVSVYSTSDPAGIKVTLTESGLNTGEFDGYAIVKTYTDDNLDYIKGAAGGTLTVESDVDPSKKDTVNIVGVPPKGIFKLDLYQSDYVTPLTTVKGGDTIYMEARGVDGNTVSSTDITTVNIISTTDPTGISVILTESGGTEFNDVFRGTAQARNASSQADGYIGANIGDTVTVTADKFALFENGSNEIWFEGEDVNVLTPNMTISAGAGTSGGKFVFVPQESEVGAAEFVLYKSTPGVQTYYLYGRLYPEDKDGKQFISRIDNGADDWIFTADGPFDTWAEPWDNGQLYSLSQGAHVFRIRNDNRKNDATRCDKAVLKLATGAPTGYGGAVVKTYPTDNLSVYNAEPTSITSVDLKTDATYATSLTTDVEVGFTLYVELAATDLDPYMKNTTTVKITSSVTDPAGINVTLTESEINSGKFRGTAAVALASNDPADEIGAATNETVTIKSNVDPTKQDTVTVDTAAHLSIDTVSTTPTEVARGQTGIAVTFTVDNSGTAEADVSAANLTFTNNDDFIVTPSGGNPAQVAGNAVDTVFTFSVDVKSGAATGTNVIDATITATDALSGANASDTGAQTTDSWVVVANAALSSAISAPSPVSVGQNFTVTMTVNNTGGAAANNVTPSALTKGGAGNATLVSGPTPASASIPAGGNQGFTWTYQASAAGAVNFTGNASGTDAYTGQPVSSSNTTSNDVTVQTAAALSSTMGAAPSLVNQGGTITVTMTVNNTGQAGADNVTPTEPTLGGTSTASKLTGPTPASAGIPGGGNQQFTWTYQAGSQNGTVNFTAHADGTDANSGNPASSSDHTSNDVTVQLGSQLTSSITSAPATASTGQTLTVTMTVNNTGEAGCNSVTPSSLTLGGTSSAAKLTGPTPASADIPGGGNQDFTWTYQASATTSGTVNFTGNASGFDAISGSPVSSAANTSNDTTIEQKASISADLSATPGIVSTGQNITVTMAVTNSGEADALGVAPTALTLGGTSTATKISGPTPASQTVPGGQSKDFTWTYQASTATGTVNFTGGASGTDENSGGGVTAPNDTSNDVTIKKAAALSADVTAVPSIVSLSQEITVTMTVSNTGEAAANGTAPSALTLGGTSTASLVSGPSPANADIPGGGNQDFTWTYTASPSAAGTVNFTGNASGTDAYSGGPVSSPNDTSNNVTVQTPAALNGSISALPSPVGVGDPITVTMTVNNTGQAGADDVTPSALTLGGTGGATLVSGPTPADADIPGGGNQDFTWTYSGSSAGDVNFTGNASGTDANDSNPVSFANQTSNDVTISTNPDAVLVSTVSAAPPTLNTGMNITVTMSVTNSGEAGASNVTPSALTKGGTGGATLVSGPNPANADIPASGNQDFTWTYQASTAGTVNFTGNASGDNDGVPPPDTVQSTSTTSNNVTVQTPAALTSGISIPATVNRNQQFTVTMNVQNTGGATANSVAPSALTVGGTSGATLVSGPTPASQNVPGGQSKNFTWTYAAGATSGTVNFTGNASGTDANSGAPVSSTSNTSNTAAVQSPAAINSSIVAAPALVSGGQTITVTMTVQNTGEATANSVAPSALTLGGTSGAVKTSGPTPASQNVPGGQAKQFTWSYTANNTSGTVNFTGNASGTDANTGSPVSSTSNTSNNVTVQKKAAISSSISAAPGTVSTGQTITVTMTVNNTGEAGANNVAPSALTLGGTSSATKVSGPTPASASIPGGGNQQYTWTYTAGSSAGTVNFTGNSSGTDANSGAPVSSTPTTSNNVTIQGAAALTSSISATPATVSSGQTITVKMTVQNTGQAGANNVAPSALTLGGTSSAAKVSGPTPASASIPGGGNQDFTWTYDAGSTSGTVNFTGNASGTDANSGLPVSSTSNTSNNVTIQTPAQLSSSILASPSSVVPSGTITVKMTVQNTGQAGANNVTPSTLTLGGTSTANYVSGPTPASASIPGGGNQQYTWTYTAGTSNGTVNFTGKASGTDANSGSPVSSSNNTSNTIIITPLTPVWVYPSSGAIGPVRSSGSVRNGVLYIGSDDDYLYAINATTGALAWKHYSRDDVVSWPFPLDRGAYWTIYYGSMGNYAYAVKDDNTSDWVTDGVNLGNRIVSTTVTDGVRMYFGCYDDRVYALDVTDGSTSWVSPTLGGDLISSPTISSTELYIGSTDGKIYALNVADGTYLRDFNTGGSVEGLPWVDVNGNLYIGSSIGKFFQLNASNFVQKWVYPTSGSIGAIISSPWVELASTAVFFGSNDDKLYALNTSSGEPLAGFTPYTTGGDVRSSPLVWNGVVYFGSDDGKVYAIDAGTGELKVGWPYNTGGVVFSSPSLDWDNNRIIVGSNVGKIFCFDAVE
ncbi:MAG: PQQ-binding-like beta-propeller repeat protein [bacterium]